eukprot:TRINITY_DN1372_c0_g1_i1.p1 TRINITY_DN1372_c0_g1~~TRINITY_DN1372_c0_g1_i1.p1  ORF type:complete len:121 (-),score=4.00 TRINITY_DN1372_c0_g1_i1:70-432(-)
MCIRDRYQRRVRDEQMSEWNEGLCGCFSDLESCFCSWCCPCVQIGRNYEAIGEGECLTCAIIFVAIECFTGLACLHHMVERGKVRDKYGIEGSPVMDLLCAWCCSCCSLAQEAREIKSRG